MLLQRRTEQFSIEEHARWLTETNLAYLLTAPSVLAGILDVYDSGAWLPRQWSRYLPWLKRFRLSCACGHGLFWAPQSRTNILHDVRPLAFQCPSGSDQYYYIASTNALVEV